MEETKYRKYIITETLQNMAHPDKNSVLLVNKELEGKIKGAFYLSIGMVTKKDGDDVSLFKPHNHDFDEDRHLSYSSQAKWADLPVPPQYNID